MSVAHIELLLQTGNREWIVLKAEILFIKSEML